MNSTDELKTKESESILKNKTDAWREVWRKGFAPLMSDEKLEILLDALLKDSPLLIQGSTTIPPPLQCVEDWPVELACAISYCGWKCDGLDTVGEVELYFAKQCFLADQNLKEYAGCRTFLLWFDVTPREEVRRELATEINNELHQRRIIRTSTTSLQ